MNWGAMLSENHPIILFFWNQQQRLDMQFVMKRRVELRELSNSEVNRRSNIFLPKPCIKILLTENIKHLGTTKYIHGMNQEYDS